MYPVIYSSSFFPETKSPLNEMTPMARRAKIQELLAELNKQPQIEFHPEHVYAPGAVARTLFIKKGSVVVGAIHKHSHLNILSQGDVTVLTEQGGLERLKGPLTMVSPAGTQRALYAHEDTTWTTIHLSEERDIEKFEAECVSKTYEDYEQFLEHEALKLENQS